MLIICVIIIHFKSQYAASVGLRRYVDNMAWHHIGCTKAFGPLNERDAFTAFVCQPQFVQFVSIVQAIQIDMGNGNLNLWRVIAMHDGIGWARHFAFKS